MQFINPSYRRPHGFTLIEVLVAVLVLSIGLLGIAGLQLKSLRDSQDAYLRSQVSILATDIGERMRANREEARAGHYDIDLTDSPTSSSTVSGRDVKAWRDRLQEVLPSGVGAIEVSSDEVTITIQWGDRSDPDNPPLLSTRPGCENHACIPS